MTAYVGKEPEPATPESAHDPSSSEQAWAHGWSRAQYQRAISAFAGAAYTGAAGFLAVLGAWLLLYGFPQSIAPEAAWYGNPLATVAATLRTIISDAFRPWLPLALVSPLIHIALFRRLRLFTPEIGAIIPFAGTKQILQGAVAGGLLLALFGTIIHSGALGEISVHATLFYAYAGTLLVFGMLLSHSACQLTQLSLRHYGVGRIRVAVVGSVDSTANIRRALKLRVDDFEYRGFVTTAEELSAEIEDPILGEVNDLEALINEHRLDELILAFDTSALPDDRRLRIAQACWRLGVDLKMVSPFHPYFKTPGRTEVLGNTPLVHVHRTGLYTTRSQFLKRAIDIAVSVILLIVLSPFLLGVAALIRLGSKGPALFSQARPGLYGRVFQIHKFRSMVVDADSELHRAAQKRLISDGAAGDTTADGRPIFGKVSNDPRVTPIGRFIRRTSIDEFPQLINVLKGEMSLVGPRPSVLYELENYSERHMARLNCRPGMTGLWQVSGRSRLSFEEMIDLDLKYISSWSIWLDLKILLRTIPVVLKIDEAF